MKDNCLLRLERGAKGPCCPDISRSSSGREDCLCYLGKLVAGPGFEPGEARLWVSLASNAARSKLVVGLGVDPSRCR